jgi:hypothetical protein
MVEAPCYKLEGRGFDSHEVIGFFSSPNHSSHTVALGSTYPLTEMSSRNLSGIKGQLVCNADNLTAISEPIV